MTALSDWTKATVSDPQPCTLCGQDAWLRHPQTGVPCRKACDDQARSIKVGGAFPGPGCECRYCANGLPVPTYTDEED